MYNCINNISKKISTRCICIIINNIIIIIYSNIEKYKDEFLNVFKK